MYFLECGNFFRSTKGIPEIFRFFQERHFFNIKEVQNSDLLQNGFPLTSLHVIEHQPLRERPPLSWKSSKSEDIQGLCHSLLHFVNIFITPALDVCWKLI